MASTLWIDLRFQPDLWIQFTHPVAKERKGEGKEEERKGGSLSGSESKAQSFNNLLFKSRSEESDERNLGFLKNSDLCEVVLLISKQPHLFKKLTVYTSLENFRKVGYLDTV